MDIVLFRPATEVVEVVMRVAELMLDSDKRLVFDILSPETTHDDGGSVGAELQLGCSGTAWNLSASSKFVQSMPLATNSFDTVHRIAANATMRKTTAFTMNVRSIMDPICLRAIGVVEAVNVGCWRRR